MPALQEYKCPCCGAGITFDSGLQKLKCPYCDTEFDVETLAAYDEVLKQSESDFHWETNAGSEWTPGEAEGMRIYACRSCGGEIVGDATTAATSCPFCGNPVVMMPQFAGTLKPDLVIPFQLDKNAACEGFKKHLEGKRLLPKVFKDENHIDEVKGIYVPFWLFDADADADIRYKATRTRFWSDSRYNYTETSYYAVSRSGTVRFSGVPVDGSRKMADDLMESLEPYDISKAVDFRTAYLAGYFADKYDVSAEDSVGRANERVKRSTEEAFAGTVTGYSSVVPESTSIRLSSGKTRYVLFPVWLLNTTWKGAKYVFAMNGQTGKFVGDLPLDKAAKNRWFWGVAAGVAAIVLGLLYLFWKLR